MGVGGGFTTSTGFAGSTTGFGAGMTGGCVTCNQALQGAPFDQVCQPPSPSKVNLQTLEMCACSKCTMECDPSLCTGNAPDPGCMSCLLSTCAAELMTCQQS
jgi:hypothetical protein